MLALGTRGYILCVHECLSCRMGVPILLHPYRCVWHGEVTREGAGLRIRLAIADKGWGAPEGLRYIAGPKHFVGTHDSNFLSRSLGEY